MEIGPHATCFEQHRSLMKGIAYRMLGSLAEAEDAVQDAYLRWQKVNPETVDSPAAYLASTVSRLCIDRQRRRKIEKLLYTGPWLPEPVNEQQLSYLNDPAFVHEKAESISMAFLLLLEKLTPLERATYILREAFDIGHEQIAHMLDIRSAHSRQLYRRAKQRIDEETPTEKPDKNYPLMEQFIKAAASGDLEQLQLLMTEDIVAYSDGGGRASAAIIPLRGRDRVATVMCHLLGKQDPNLTMAACLVNGEPGIVVRDNDGIHSVHTITVVDGKIHRSYSVRNPEKLRFF